jgi:hypothetical protein
MPSTHVAGAVRVRRRRCANKAAIERISRRFSSIAAKRVDEFPRSGRDAVEVYLVVRIELCGFVAGRQSFRLPHVSGQRKLLLWLDGVADVLQVSPGEPTTHPDLLQMVRHASEQLTATRQTERLRGTRRDI